MFILPKCIILPTYGKIKEGFFFWDTLIPAPWNSIDVLKNWKVTLPMLPKGLFPVRVHCFVNPNTLLQLHNSVPVMHELAKWSNFVNIRGVLARFFRLRWENMASGHHQTPATRQKEYGRLGGDFHTSPVITGVPCWWVIFVRFLSKPAVYHSKLGESR